MVKRPADSNLSLKKTAHKKSKKEPQLHKLIFEVGGLPDGTEVYYRTPAENFLGKKQGFGIYCLCCNEEVKPTKFEAHAGMASRRKPYENIYLQSGMSLHDYALELKPNNQDLANNDNDVCRVRETGGHVSCGGCRKLVRKECLSETGTSREVLCQKCAKPCIKIASGSFACVLCRAYDFIDGRVFHDRTSLICNQCEKEYHIGCLNKRKEETKLEEVPGDDVKWYCTLVCQEIDYQLDILMKCGPEKVPNYLLDFIRKKSKEGDVNFRLIRGKNVMEAFESNRCLLRDALKIFHEQFGPIIDRGTRRDFITRMAYGNHIGASFDFSGVCTAMLTVKHGRTLVETGEGHGPPKTLRSEVVTAGMFRVFGEATAELSIVATSEPYKQKGYFSVLFKCIEKLLSYLCIKKIVITASVDAESMWKEKFGFENMSTEQMEEYRKTQPSMMALMGTSVLVKEVPTGQRTFRDLKTFRLKEKTNV